MNARVIDMTGKRFSSLVAIRICGKSASGDLKWLFKCDCGTEFEANGYYARIGKIINCPSCAMERSRTGSLKHGMSLSNEFEIWTGILTRCYNKNAKAFKNYGGRGIVMCDQWRDSFERFLADMGIRPSLGHSIERRNNDGIYEPSNCYWATRSEQANNKRNNLNISIDGVTKTASQWASELGLSRAALYQRIRYHPKLKSKTSELMRPVVKGSVEFNGQRDTFAGWSKRTGIKSSTIAMRIHSCGWSIEKALTQGASL